MHHRLIFLCGVFGFAITASAVLGQHTDTSRERDEPSKLADQVRNRDLPSIERDSSLSGLAHLSFEKAVQVAPALLAEPYEGIRFRAAWILADDGNELGLQALRAMASDKSIERSTLAAKALARLRDPEAHEMLRSLLAAEVADQNMSRSRPRAGAFVDALSEYADPRDTALLVGAVTRYLERGGGIYLEPDYVSRAGNPDAIPVLEEIFAGRGKGWAVMSAGLGLGRCGSEKGKKYVSDRLADIRGCVYPDGFTTDSDKDDPYGPRAMHFILERMGAPSDEIFVPELVRIVSGSSFGETAKAKAWMALLHINSSKYRPQILELAWRAAGYSGAVKLIALNDAVAGARTRLSAVAQGKAEGVQPRHAAAIEEALRTTPRERRRWLESKGYAF